MKLAQLVHPSGVSALQKLRASQPPVRLAFRFLQVWDAIEPILRRYEEQRLALLRKYAREAGDEFRFVNEAGDVDRAAIEAFIAEHNALLEEEVAVPPQRFSAEEFDQFNAKLTVEEIGAVRWLLEE